MPTKVAKEAISVKTILIVDDNKVSLASAKFALEDTYRIAAATSGAQALKYLEKKSCDLILLDINMPGMDGFETMKRIRQNRRNDKIPIIFLTADNDSKTENYSLEVGALDYITKPFVINVMRARIARILELCDLRNNLEERLEERTKHIMQMQESIVLGMATMVERRDNSTGGHIKRTSMVVKIFSDKLLECDSTLSEEFLRNVIRAAPMHDLGKIALDDCILRKQGKFTEEEYEKMKQHAPEGAKIVNEILQNVEEEDFLKIAVNVANYHHEKWNGLGYPEGLSGEDIPIEARIMALADVFDALVSKRCYKEAFSYDKAFQIIEESLGSHFNPKLGKIFLSCRPELEALYNQVDK